MSRPNKNYVDIDRDHFDYVVDAMEEVVVSGSARRAYMKELEICGKTSTVQNPHGYDHSGFIGFAPKNEPELLSLHILKILAGEAGQLLQLLV